jgi:dihydrofolate reductase
MNATRVPIAIVVAAAENGVIGRGGALPWRMPADLRAFRRLTLGKPVVMGRRTFAAIGRPLDGRDNIVVTRDTTFSAAGVAVAHSVDEALELARQAALARGASEIAIIGGADVYRQALARADRVYLTRIHAAVDGDARFPDPDPATWSVAETTDLVTDARDDHRATLIVFERITAVVD